MSECSAGRAADTFFLPSLGASTTQAGVDTSVYTLATTNAAARVALTLPTNKEKVYVTITVVGATSYIALKLGTAAASVTTTTGFPLVAGTIISGWINPSEVNDLEGITASSTGTVFVYASSPKYEGK